MNRKTTDIRVEKRVALVILALTALGMLAFTLWAGPALATWTVTGRWPRLPYTRALIAAFATALSIPHAAHHYPHLVRAASRAQVRWWLSIAMLCLGELAAAAAALRKLDNIASEPVADRRFWQLRGISPRTFGRTHTIAPLLIDRRQVLSDTLDGDGGGGRRRRA